MIILRYTSICFVACKDAPNQKSSIFWHDKFWLFVLVNINSLVLDLDGKDLLGSSYDESVKQGEKLGKLFTYVRIIVGPPC